MFCNRCGGRVRRDRHRHLFHVGTGRKRCPKLHQEARVVFPLPVSVTL